MHAFWLAYLPDGGLNGRCDLRSFALPQTEPAVL
jgi:hypothetical protein